jgi:hypothetical protein
MSSYTAKEVSEAARLLEEDSQLIARVQMYATDMDLNDPIAKTESFHADLDVPVSIGSLLIAAACRDDIDIATAHFCLKHELLYAQGEKDVPYEGTETQASYRAVTDAYEILDAHGAITVERFEVVKQKNIKFTDELRAIDAAFKAAAKAKVVKPDRVAVPNPGHRIIKLSDVRKKLEGNA